MPGRPRFLPTHDGQERSFSFGRLRAASNEVQHVESMPEALSPDSTLSRYAQRVRRAGLLRSSMFAVLLSVPLAVGLAAVANHFWPSQRHDLDTFNRFGLIAVGVFFGPLLETVIFQLLVGIAIRHFIQRIDLRLLLITIPFALSHFPQGAATGLGAGVVGGLVFGFLFIAWQDVSASKAFWAALLPHSMHNAVALGLGEFWS